MRKPDFFIVGAPRCGTTTLYSWLKQHPEVFMPDKKEPRFFCSDLDSGSERDSFFFMRDEAAYLSLFRSADKVKRVGEASPLYLYSDVAARRIKEFCGSVSIIILLRNPVDMLYSHHSKRCYNGDEDITDFGAALAAENDRKKGLRLPKNAANLKGLFYRDFVKFSAQVQRYLDVFGRENVRIILFDDLKNEPRRIYHETLAFLGIHRSFTPEFRIANQNKQPRSNILKSIVRNPSGPLRNIARTLLPDTSRRKFATYLARHNQKFVPRHPMDPQLRKKLIKEFEPDVRALSQLLGRDLSHWSI